MKAVYWRMPDDSYHTVAGRRDIAWLLLQMRNGEIAWLEGPGGRFRIWALSGGTTDDSPATQWIVYESEDDESEWTSVGVRGFDYDAARAALDKIAEELLLLAREGVEGVNRRKAEVNSEAG